MILIAELFGVIFSFEVTIIYDFGSRLISVYNSLPITFPKIVFRGGVLDLLTTIFVWGTVAEWSVDLPESTLVQTVSGLNRELFL